MFFSNNYFKHIYCAFILFLMPCSSVLASANHLDERISDSHGFLRFLKSHKRSLESFVFRLKVDSEGMIYDPELETKFFIVKDEQAKQGSKIMFSLPPVDCGVFGLSCLFSENEKPEQQKKQVSSRLGEYFQRKEDGLTKISEFESDCEVDFANDPENFITRLIGKLWNSYEVGDELSRKTILALIRVHPMLGKKLSVGKHILFQGSLVSCLGRNNYSIDDEQEIIEYLLSSPVPSNWREGRGYIEKGYDIYKTLIKVLSVQKDKIRAYDAFEEGCNCNGCAMPKKCCQSYFNVASIARIVHDEIEDQGCREKVVERLQKTLKNGGYYPSMFKSIIEDLLYIRKKHSPELEVYRKISEELDEIKDKAIMRYGSLENL